MNILITGIRGFVASHLIPYLKNKGHNCILFDADVRNKNYTEKLIINNEIDAVIHLIGKFTGGNEKVFQEINIQGTRNIIEACKKKKPNLFIFLSTARVLSRFKNPYADSKSKAEEIIINSGISYAILRPSLIYGFGDKKNLGIFFKLLNKLPIMPIFDFKIQPVFIGDLIKIIEQCLFLEKNQIINLVGKEIISFSQAMKQAKLIQNSPCRLICLPKFLFLPIKLFVYLPFFPISPWQFKTAFADEIFIPDPWWNLFNIKPTKFFEGLKQTLK